MTIEDLAADILDIKTKINEMYLVSPVGQLANMNSMNLLQERQTILSLQMEGYTKAEAIAYWTRMKNGERPWLDE